MSLVDLDYADPDSDHSMRHRQITASASRQQPSLFFLTGLKDTLFDITMLADKMERKFNTSAGGDQSQSIP
jgi:hypothetical protein